MPVDQEVRALWARLEAWAASNAPAMTEELRGPADDSSLARFEGEAGLSLSPGLRASLLVHDGEDGPRYSAAWVDAGELLGADDILERWTRYQQFAEEPDAGAIAEAVADGAIQVEGPVWAVVFHRAWIPFMELNGGDRTWYVDLAPAPGGSAGQIVLVDPECGEWRVVAPSYESFLRDYVEALESGAYAERDADGLPTAEASDPSDVAPDDASLDALGPEMARIARMARELTKTTLPLNELEQLPPGAEAEVAGVVLSSSLFRKLHEVSVWGGAIRVRGDLGPKPRRHKLVKLRVRVPHEGSPEKRVYDALSFEALA